MDQSQLKYAKTHEWVALEGESVTIGITDFAVHQLTDLVYLALPKVGKAIVAASPFGEVESVKAASDLYSPVSGEITAVNAALADNLDWLSTDPFGKGWIIKVKVGPNLDLSHLMDAAAYKAFCDSEAH